ncbi:hypothetical protein SESBI_42523 [Sesbania bispinosa]|nr:hypothetical protein SESBI_42523 [Sesbania bispinosa]
MWIDPCQVIFAEVEDFSRLGGETEKPAYIGGKEDYVKPVLRCFMEKFDPGRLCVDLAVVISGWCGGGVL